MAKQEIGRPNETSAQGPERRETTQAQPTELSDDQLERVAGGSNGFAIWITTGPLPGTRQVTIVQDL